MTPSGGYASRLKRGGRRALSSSFLLLLPTLNTERLIMYPLSSPLVFLLLSLLSQGFLLLLLLFLLLRALKSNPILEAEAASLSLPKCFLLTPPLFPDKKVCFPLYLNIFFFYSIFREVKVGKRAAFVFRLNEVDVSQGRKREKER